MRAGRLSEHLGTLWRLRKMADRVQGGTTKGIGHDDPKTPAIYRSRRKPRISGVAAPRHRRLPAHDRAAVRWPREIDPRARRSDEERRADHAGDAEECVRRRSNAGFDLRDRYACQRFAAAEIARRHREGAGRRARARPRPEIYAANRILRG